MPKPMWEVNYATLNIYWHHVILKETGGCKVFFYAFIGQYFPGKPHISRLENNAHDYR